MGWWKRKKPDVTNNIDKRLFGRSESTSFGEEQSRPYRSKKVYSQVDRIPQNFGNLRPKDATFTWTMPEDKQEGKWLGFHELSQGTAGIGARTRPGSYIEKFREESGLLTEATVDRLKRKFSTILTDGVFDRFLEDSVRFVGEEILLQFSCPDYNCKRSGIQEDESAELKDGWEADEEESNGNDDEMQGDPYVLESAEKPKEKYCVASENMSFNSMYASERKSQLWEWATVGAEGLPPVVHQDPTSQSDSAGDNNEVNYNGEEIPIAPHQGPPAQTESSGGNSDMEDGAKDLPVVHHDHSKPKPASDSHEMEGEELETQVVCIPSKEAPVAAHGNSNQQKEVANAEPGEGFGSPVSLPQSSRQCSPDKAMKKGKGSPEKEGQGTLSRAGSRRNTARCIWPREKKDEEMPSQPANEAAAVANCSSMDEILSVDESNPCIQLVSGSLVLAEGEGSARQRKTWSSVSTSEFRGDLGPENPQNTDPIAPTPSESQADAEAKISFLGSLKQTAHDEMTETAATGAIPDPPELTQDDIKEGRESLTQERYVLEQQRQEGLLEMSKTAKLAKALREAVENLTKAHGSDGSSALNELSGPAEFMPAAAIDPPAAVQDVNPNHSMESNDLPSMELSAKHSEVDGDALQAAVLPSKAKEHEMAKDMSEAQGKRLLRDWFQQMQRAESGEENKKEVSGQDEMAEAEGQRFSDPISSNIHQLRAQMRRLQLSSGKERLRKTAAAPVSKKSVKNALGKPLPSQKPDTRRLPSFGKPVADENADALPREGRASGQISSVAKGLKTAFSVVNGGKTFWHEPRSLLKPSEAAPKLDLSPRKTQKVSPMSKQVSKFGTLSDIIEHEENKDGIHLREIDRNYARNNQPSVRAKTWSRKASSKLPRLWLASDTEDEGASSRK